MLIKKKHNLMKPSILVFAFLLLMQTLLQGCGFRLRGHDAHKTKSIQIENMQNTQNMQGNISSDKNNTPALLLENKTKSDHKSLTIQLNNHNISEALKKQLLYEIDKTHFSALEKNKFKNIELTVFDENYREEIQVLNAQGQVREIKLIKNVLFSIKDVENSKTLLTSQKVEVMSDFSVSEALILSKTTEKQRIIENLQKQLAHDLLLKSFYFLQSY